MRKANAAGLCTLLNIDDPLWFMHTSRAARQALDIVMGTVAPPLHLRELVLEIPHTRETVFAAPQLVQQADAVLVEVCTLNAADVQGWEANAHLLWHAKKNNDPRLDLVRHRVETAEEIARNIGEIREMVCKPVMVVNHITPCGIAAVDTARARLTAVLREAETSGGFRLFDTAHVLAYVDPATALQDQNHYKADFEVTMGRAMFAALQEMLDPVPGQMAPM